MRAGSRQLTGTFAQGRFLLEMQFYNTRRQSYYVMQVVYFQQDTYPNSPALVMSPDDDDLSGVLQSLNDQFEEYSLLTDVVKAVCSTLGYGEFTSTKLPAARLDESLLLMQVCISLCGDLFAGADEAMLGEIATSQASDEDEFGGEGGSEDEEDQGNMWGIGENDDEELIKEVLQKSSRCTLLLP